MASRMELLLEGGRWGGREGGLGRGQSGAGITKGKTSWCGSNNSGGLVPWLGWLGFSPRAAAASLHVGPTSLFPPLPCMRALAPVSGKDRLVNAPAADMAGRCRNCKRARRRDSRLLLETWLAWVWVLALPNIPVQRSKGRPFDGIVVCQSPTSLFVLRTLTYATFVLVPVEVLEAKSKTTYALSTFAHARTGKQRSRLPNKSTGVQLAVPSAAPGTNEQKQSNGASFTLERFTSAGPLPRLICAFPSCVLSTSSPMVPDVACVCHFPEEKGTSPMNP